VLNTYIQAVVEGETLSREQARQAMTIVMEGEATPAQIGSFFTALRMRGETDDELAGFAEVMREKALPVVVDGSRPIVDTCGTGGDGSHSFNVSTTAAFVVAGAGVRVAKHGNRAMTSKSGSADLLETLGVVIDLSPEQVGACIEQAGIGFMFAQKFHPAMRFAAPVRREIGIRTAFNLLGPLTNPAGVRHQVIGVPNPVVATKLANVLALLDREHCLVVHAHEGMDELGVSGPSTIAEMRRGSDVVVREVEPEQFGLGRHEREAIRGGTPEENVAITRSVLSGQPGARLDITLLNAGAALYAVDAVSSIGDGVAMARESIDSGAAAAKLEELVRLSQRLANRNVSVSV
jgi:anthranilate phosphoribosyltransferase